MSHPVRSPRPRALAALALSACLALTGCGGGGDKGSSGDKSPAPQATASGKVLASVWPLTGLPAPAGLENHPVVAVKIPNTAEADPQVGMGQADMVVQELVEGGITRLAVVFNTQIPKLVGPVRSLRATDIGIVKPLHGLVVASGAAPPTIARLNGAHVNFLQGGPGYFRTPGRRAPYNLMVHLPQAIKAARSVGEPSGGGTYLPFGTAADFKGVRPARHITLRFTSGGRSFDFGYDPATQRYTNTNGYAPARDQFKAGNLLVLRVRVGDAGYRDPAGNPVPETLFTGSGNALLFHGGKVLPVTWHKKDNKSAISLTLRNGGKVTVPAGRTWIGLVPVNPYGGAVTFRP